MESATLKVRDEKGKFFEVACTLEDHPTYYGNGKMVVMQSPRFLDGCHPGGRRVFDTRYCSLSDCGGLVGFCAQQLELDGFEVVDESSGKGVVVTLSFTFTVDAFASDCATEWEAVDWCAELWPEINPVDMEPDSVEVVCADGRKLTIYQ